MLFESLFQHAASQGQEVAIIDDRGRYTWQQLATMASGLSMYFSFQTQKKTIGLLLPPGAGFVASFYGALVAGKTVVPLNYLLGDREIAHIVQDSGIDAVATVAPLAGRLKDLPVKAMDLLQLPQVAPGSLPSPRLPTVAADDLAVLLYTSGTSGLPKGVMLSFGNLQSDVDACIRHADLQQKHRFLGVIPLFHSFGMTGMMLAPVQLGAPVVYLARFSPVGAQQAIKEHGVSLVFGVPSMYAAILRLKTATAEDFKSLYAAISGGEPLPVTLREGFRQRFGVALYEGYGLTETSPVVTLNVPQAHKPGTVGRPVPGAEIRIADENNQAVPAGQIGEIRIRGPMVMKGYHNLPRETAEAISGDGFFRTGDLGMLDSDGYLSITGRSKEMIIVAGEKAYPREIEDHLLEHPAVAEAAVIGRKDPGRGEAIVAFVIAREGQDVTEAELREFCRSQGLAPWKCPREVHVVPELPRSPTGKVLKRVLAEQLKSEI